MAQRKLLASSDKSPYFIKNNVLFVESRESLVKISEIVTLLKENELKHLGCNWISLEAREIQALDAALTAGNINLTSISLLGTAFNTSAASELAKALRSGSLTKIESFSIYYNPTLEDEHIAILEAGLRYHQHLKILNFSYNKCIQDEGAKKIAQILYTCPNLEELHLIDSNIGVQGATALAHAVKFHQGLKVLSMKFIPLGDKGISQLSKGLSMNKEITDINLRGTHFGDKGVSKLAPALRRNSKLTKLGLFGNYICDNGAEVLCKALRTNTDLTALDLYQNDIKQIGAKHIARLIGGSTMLTDLHLADNKIGKGIIEIKQALNAKGANETLLTMEQIMAPPNLRK